MNFKYMLDATPEEFSQTESGSTVSYLALSASHKRGMLQLAEKAYSEMKGALAQRRAKPVEALAMTIFNPPA